ncbi:D-galactonate transporter [Microcoleus sp. LEGE 07076]
MISYWLLVIGYWLLVIGYFLLVWGCLTVNSHHSLVNELTS